ncbi:glycine--tRNA ligase subunit beta [Brevundimonas sp.]|jgi:glycyl-tRNA synthetase beta chain|uniref:glycine--tRNA ligase subunit beta n=1 Tax=Brevundimonas sp. TaxID=1871086 RepID=UPI002E1410BE|nr:glycine--tRNA ligase subunit beta [Brevundimonas sp.]
MPQLLLELFSEEIPARMQAGAARDLERMATDRLKAAGLTFDALTTYAGPRRLTLVVDGLPAATPDREEELKGPKATAPEPALEGFLRKTGLTRDQLVERDGVLFAVISQKGRATADLIPAMVDEIVRGFPWPKSMRWGTGTLRWVRPLKRIVCLFDGEVVPFDVDGVASGEVTEGHRFMARDPADLAPFSVTDFASYREGLARRFVTIDAAERRRQILEVGRANCAMLGLELVEDEGLADEVAGLVEFPVPTVGDMDPAFLDLPPEVIRLSMKTHQKYFAVRDPKSGNLAPHFVVVANVQTTDENRTLAAGNSRVLSARLNDARFFWDEDRKTGFDAWLKKLEGVTFHAKLGTMADRVERIAALAREIAPLVGADPDEAALVARLAKADLASGMVGEFPELQGIMGGYYAGGLAELPESLRGSVTWTNDLRERTAWAVREQYRPQGPSDAVPTAPLTVAVALADKLDTLVGFFAIDEKPTGSKDPFALRRAALGVIRILLESGSRAPMRLLLGAPAARIMFQQQRMQIDEHDRLAAELSDAGLQRAAEAIWRETDTAFDRPKALAFLRTNTPRAITLFSDLLAFFADRLKVLLRDQGKRHDLVDAVFALGDDDLVRIVRRVEALDAFLATDDGANLLAGHRRASNILKAEAKKGDVPTGMVQTGLPNQPAEETALAFAAAAAQTAVDQALETEDFAAAMRALSALRAPVDAFFEAVLVNSDVPAERDNRLKLLGQIRAVMGRVADFDRISG